MASQEVEKCMISHPFYCVHEDAVASQEVQKVHDIHILSVACGKMPWPPRKWRRCMISHPFFCLQEYAMASHELEKVHDITSFLLLAGRCRGLPGSGEGA
jgi:hypothetical protein